MGLHIALVSSFLFVVVVLVLSFRNLSVFSFCMMVCDVCILSGDVVLYSFDNIQLPYGFPPCYDYFVCD